MTRSTRAFLAGAWVVCACSSSGSGDPNAQGGTSAARGGSANGGVIGANGGVPQGFGGATSGGASALGGAGGATAGRAGSSNGGANASGGPGGGAAGLGAIAGAGGVSGAAQGGVGPAGAAGSAGSAGASAGSAGAGGGSTFTASYFLGADVTFQEPEPEATRANLLSMLKAHGFNSIRLRTFVDPKAADGYDQVNGTADLAHTVAFGKQIKAAGMGLFIDFHYSDNWADPSKQCVPIAWQSYTTITQLATTLHDYTKSAITALIAGGARPDLVQIGNEITPGMLLHRCDRDGLPTGANPVTGSSDKWENLGPLLKAGVDAVREVDSKILVSFHIDRGGDKATDKAGAALETSTWWLDNALKYATPDAFGESCYQKYQGDPNSVSNTKATWTSTLGGLASKYPNIKIFAAEYGPMQREINDVVFGLPNQQGLGTFNWEPAKQGDWNTGHDLLRPSGNTFTAQPDLALYDLMKAAYQSRL